MKDVGIVGMPEADPGSVFTALTAVEDAGGSKANQAVVPVPDPRVDELTRLHESKKSTYTQLRFVDTSSLVRAGGRAGTGRLSAELLGHLRAADAVLLVVRGDVAAADAEEMSLELLYADLDVIGKKVERDRKSVKDAEGKRELAILERAIETLQAGSGLQTVAWDPDELRAFQGIQPLTLKPTLVVATIEDGSQELPVGVVGVAAGLEREVAGMDEAEAAELLEGFGIVERALPTVIRRVYEMLDLLTFLTAGDIESRAWEIPRGATAPEAAGAIHSDIQRGFIRAEIVGYDDLVGAGSWTAARAQGLARQEGKAYVMREGDVVEFKFAV